MSLAGWHGQVIIIFGR